MIAAQHGLTGGLGQDHRFNAAAGQSYSALRSDRLVPAAWVKVADIGAAPTNRTVTVTNLVDTAPTRFYRLITPQQP